jgi:hypothetical protein
MKDDTVEKDLMVRNTETLDALTSTTLLSAEDMEKYKACLPAIGHAFFHTQMFRTRTEMFVSVLNDVNFPTPDAKYWQSIREMNVMAENLIALSFTYKEKLLDLEERKQELNDFGGLTPSTTFQTRIAIERKNLAIKRTEFEIACVQREAHHRIREIDQWRLIQEELLPKLGAGSDDVDNHQLFSYVLRFLQEYYIAETGRVNKDLDSYRNLKSLLVTALAAIDRAKLTAELVKVLQEGDPKLLRFARGKSLLK